MEKRSELRSLLIDGLVIYCIRDIATEHGHWNKTMAQNLFLPIIKTECKCQSVKIDLYAPSLKMSSCIKLLCHMLI